MGAESSHLHTYIFIQYSAHTQPAKNLVFMKPYASDDQEVGAVLLLLLQKTAHPIIDVLPPQDDDNAGGICVR